MTAARLFREPCATVRSQFCDVAGTPHLRFWIACESRVTSFWPRKGN